VSSQPCLRGFAKLATLFAAVSALAACNALSTEPTASGSSRHTVPSHGMARHDDGDSLAVCLGGYIIVNGITVCAD